MNVRADLSALLTPSDADRATAERMLAEYASRGHLRRTCREMLTSSHAAIALFYAGLACDPHCARFSARANSGWMADTDFCFVNVRATGIDDRPGNCLQAAKLLPALRVGEVHLGPFTDNDFGTIYAPRSVRTIALQVVDPQVDLTPEQQPRAFVEAAHMLGKQVLWTAIHRSRSAERPDIGNFAERRAARSRPTPSWASI